VWKRHNDFVHIGKLITVDLFWRLAATFEEERYRKEELTSIIIRLLRIDNLHIGGEQEQFNIEEIC
jgi:hypothetical protein